MDETAQKMNDALKKAGFNRRQVTVRHRRSLYDDDYRIKIRDPKVSLLQIEEIVGEFESIRYDEYSGEILEGCNNYVSVSRDGEHPVDISQILPLVEPALTKAMQEGHDQRVQLPARRYLIGLAQRGNPDLWGMKPDYIIVRFEQRAESLFSGFPSPIEPNPGHDTGKRPTSNLLRGDLPREELPSSLKKTLPLHLQRRSASQPEKFCSLAFIPARFLHGFFNVMATHLVKDFIQVEITAERNPTIEALSEFVVDI